MWNFDSVCIPANKNPRLNECLFLEMNFKKNASAFYSNAFKREKSLEWTANHVTFFFFFHTVQGRWLKTNQILRTFFVWILVSSGSCMPLLGWKKQGGDPPDRLCLKSCSLSWTLKARKMCCLYMWLSLSPLRFWKDTPCPPNHQKCGVFLAIESNIGLCALCLFVSVFISLVRTK